MARKFPDDGPHLVYLPERVFELERFLADVKAMYERHGRCVIAVSEGIHDAAVASGFQHDADERLVDHRRGAAALGDQNLCGFVHAPTFL